VATLVTSRHLPHLSWLMGPRSPQYATQGYCSSQWSGPTGCKRRRKRSREAMSGGRDKRRAAAAVEGCWRGGVGWMPEQARRGGQEGEQAKGSEQAKTPHAVCVVLCCADSPGTC
jgi:hypothetical protein